MSSAPTPPPHVPVNFLKAGGGAFFSAACQKAIADLGWNPDEFGSYEGTKDYIDRCRAKVAAGTATGREAELGRAWNTPSGSRDPQAYTSGHLVMNATMQGTRGDLCTNRVNGYHHNLAPSMPHQGLPQDSGSQHQGHTVREYAHAQSGGAVRDGTYANAGSPEAALSQARADARSRARTLVEQRQEQLQAQANQNQSGGGSQQANVASNKSLAEQAGVAPGTAGTPTAPEAHQVDGKDAAECIENFVDMAFEGMLANAKDPNVIAANQAAAGSASAPTPADVARFEADRNSARGRLGAAVRKHGNTDPPHPDVTKARNELTATQQDLSNATGGGAQAACMAQQGQALNNGQATRQGGPRQPTGSAPQAGNVNTAGQEGGF